MAVNFVSGLAVQDGPGLVLVLVLREEGRSFLLVRCDGGDATHVRHRIVQPCSHRLALPRYITPMRFTVLGVMAARGLQTATKLAVVQSQIRNYPRQQGSSSGRLPETGFKAGEVTTWNCNHGERFIVQLRCILYATNTRRTTLHLLLKAWLFRVSTSRPSADFPASSCQFDPRFGSLQH